MTISFQYLANLIDGIGHNQHWRVMELAAMMGVRASQDASNGRVGRAASGVELVPDVPITRLGVLFLVDHKSGMDRDDIQASKYWNTVLLDGESYLCSTQLKGKTYRGAAIMPVVLDVTKLMNEAVPRTMTPPPSGVQQQVSPTQQSGGGVTDPSNYNNLPAAPAQPARRGGC